MLDSVFSFFEKLLINFTWTRFTFLVGAVCLVVGSLLSFEFYTGHFRLERMEHQLTLLEKLVTLGPKVEKLNLADPARTAYVLLEEQVEKEIKGIDLPAITMPGIPSRTLYTCIPWLALGLLVSLTTKGNRLTALAGMTMFAAPIIAIGLNLPESWNPWILNHGYPWGSMLLVVLGIILYQKIRAA